ncbi:MAG: type IX secretion system protein PorQ [Bacteroidales bacterium]|nr:type IX secretion system protein PorQ [Bacteroidales bacterium]MDD4634700.1 type IX secretion system protein PorQ [Bacteroidales bacterium]
MANKILNILIINFLAVVSCIAQTGGTGTYTFMSSTTSPRLAAMGVDFASFYDDDINLACANPSLINKNMHNDAALSFIDYFSDITMGYASYSRTFEKAGSFAATMQYANYGSFQYADATGETSGTFTANELAAVIGWGRTLTDRWSIGANFKMIYSGLETYNSFGLAVDVAGTYHIAEKNFDMSLIAKNIGAELISYYSERSSLPFEIQFAISQKLEHLPFRWIILLHDMQKWNLRYDDPTDEVTTLDPATGLPIEKTAAAKFGDNLMRHVTIGGEFTIAKIIYLRLGYNYQRQQELKLADLRSAAGFSFGLGLDIYKFEISYSHTVYTMAGAPNYISIKTKISDWIK